MKISIHWSEINFLRNGPGARSSHGVSLIKYGEDDGMALVVFGGEQTPRVPVDDRVYLLSDLQRPDQCKWRVHGPRDGDTPWPAERLGHSQSSDGEGRIWVFGGRQGITMGEKSLHDLWKLDAGTMRWRKFTPASSDSKWPSERSYHASAFGGGKLFVFGGCGTNGRLADLHFFDAKQELWSELPSPTIPGKGGASLAVNPAGTKLVVACGFAGHETNDVQVFDVASSQWTEIDSSWLQPRSVAANFCYRETLVVFGGEVEPSNRGHEGAENFANDAVGIDIASGSKVEIGVVDGPMPPSRGWTAGAACDDTAVLFGGLSGDDKNPTRHDDVWIARFEIS